MVYHYLLSLPLLLSFLHTESPKGKSTKQKKREKKRTQNEACRISSKVPKLAGARSIALRAEQEKEKKKKGKKSPVDSGGILNLGEGVAVSSHFVGLFHVEFGKLLGLLALS